MKKIVLINGLIAGAICGGMLLTTQPLFESGALNPDSGMYVGYATMVIAFSLIFFGIKQYRDQQSTQSISFGRALKVGLFITIVAALVYAITWEVYYSQKGEEFMAFYAKCYIDNLKSDGATEAELVEGKAYMASMNEYYKNPLIRFTMTLMEIFPVGLVVSLISAALLKRKDFLPGSTTTTVSA